MGTIRIIVFSLGSIEQEVYEALKDQDLLARCIDAFGEPASVANFAIGVQADEKLPPDLKDLILAEIDLFYPMGWWFVSKAADSPLAGQMVRVTALEGEGDAMVATVSTVSAKDDDVDREPKVLTKHLSGKPT